MITYTKRNITLLAASLTILIFMLFYIAYSIYLLKSNENLFVSQNVYSKTIPSYLLKNKNLNIKNVNGKNTSNFYGQILQIKQPLSQKSKENKKIELQEKSNTPLTQRQVIKENENNKWRIEIPKINLNVHIQEGTSNEVMLESVGHFEQTSKWNGNVGLAAHNRGYKCNYFQEIKKLSTGDEIIYTTTKGKKVYEVQLNKTILETDWSYLEKTKEDCITLITCEENRKEYRRCIRAIQIAEYLE